MATANDSSRPSPGPLNKDQRARLESLQFARELVRTYPRQDETLFLDNLLTLAHYIETGETYR